MKNHCLFFVAFLVFASCKTFKIRDSKLEGIDDFDVTVEKVIRSRGQSTWGGGGIVPPKGHKFFFLNLKIVNDSNSERTIDFTDFGLADTERKILYPLVDVYKPSIVVLPAKSKKKLKPGKSLRRNLMFSFPKEKIPDYVMYKDELINLHIN